MLYIKINKFKRATEICGCSFEKKIIIINNEKINEISNKKEIGLTCNIYSMEIKKGFHFGNFFYIVMFITFVLKNV